MYLYIVNVFAYSECIYIESIYLYRIGLFIETILKVIKEWS